LFFSPDVQIAAIEMYKKACPDRGARIYYMSEAVQAVRNLIQLNTDQRLRTFPLQFLRVHHKTVEERRWVMLLHPDEYFYHDPRLVRARFPRASACPAVRVSESALKAQPRATGDGFQNERGSLSLFACPITTPLQLLGLRHRRSQRSVSLAALTAAAFDSSFYNPTRGKWEGCLHFTAVLATLVPPTSE